ncbi:MAG TPA: hypothetical protein VNM39_10780 [Verrucomicrobiae bacterium]|nr:hypothetical protein [Verrucomicrobiae bacterium]
MKDDGAFRRALDRELDLAEMAIQAEYMRQLNEWLEDWQPTGLAFLTEGVERRELGE